MAARIREASAICAHLLSMPPQNTGGDVLPVQRPVNRRVRRRKKPCFLGAACSLLDGDCATTCRDGRLPPLGAFTAWLAATSAPGAPPERRPRPPRRRRRLPSPATSSFGVEAGTGTGAEGVLLFATAASGS